MTMLFLGVSQNDVSLLMRSVFNQDNNWQLQDSGQWAYQHANGAFENVLAKVAGQKFVGSGFSRAYVSTNVPTHLADEARTRLDQVDGKFDFVKPLDPEFTDAKEIAKNQLGLSSYLIGKAVTGSIESDKLKLYFVKGLSDPALGEVMCNDNYLSSKPIDNLIVHSFSMPLSTDDYLAVSQATERVLRLFKEERKRADSLHGTMPRNRDKHYWITALVEEIGEVARAIQDEGDQQYENELVQVGALAISAIVDLQLSSGRDT